MIVGEEELELRNIICPNCGGTGRLKQETDHLHFAGPPTRNKKVHHSEYDISFEFTYICPKCGGKGKVDWISNIVGSKELIITSTQHHKGDHYQWTKL